MTDSIEFSPVTGDRRANMASDPERPVPDMPSPGALRPLARALLRVAAEIVAARRAPLGTGRDVRLGSVMSFGRSVGRHSSRHRAASPDVTGPEGANVHVGAPAGSPVADADLMDGSS